MIRASSEGLSFSRHWLLAALVVSSAACACAEEEIKPPARPTAQQETDSVAALVRTQKGPDAITPKVQNAAQSVFARTFGALQSTPPKVECTANGCLFEVVYPDRCTALRADAIFSSRQTPVTYEWPGSVTRTPPISAENGRVSVTWALLISPSQYDALDKIPRPDNSPPPPPPVMACPATTRPPVKLNVDGATPPPEAK